MYVVEIKVIVLGSKCI